MRAIISFKAKIKANENEYIFCLDLLLPHDLVLVVLHFILKRLKKERARKKTAERNRRRDKHNFLLSLTSYTNENLLTFTYGRTSAHIKLLR